MGENSDNLKALFEQGLTVEALKWLASECLDAAIWMSLKN